MKIIEHDFGTYFLMAALIQEEGGVSNYEHIKCRIIMYSYI